jgi:activator of 2-hydroxyglutaryl-CoA dehydratase
MLKRYPCRTIVFVGGVARNQAVVNGLRRPGDYEVIIPEEPQFNGALGCCLEEGRGQ